MGKKTKPIYGLANNDPCCDTYLRNLMTTTFSDMVNNLEKIISTLFPSFKAVSMITADLHAYLGLPPLIIVRLIWVELYPGLIFEPQNKSHIYLLKDIYDSNNLDYFNDPVIVNNISVNAEDT